MDNSPWRCGFMDRHGSPFSPSVQIRFLSQRNGGRLKAVFSQCSCVIYLNKKCWVTVIGALGDVIFLSFSEQKIK